jgi:asparagine synthase (glutamine-hydrolysing)
LRALNEVIGITETFDITTIRASVGQYLIAKKISEQTDIKVVLNGDGAD